MWMPCYGSHANAALDTLSAAAGDLLVGDPHGCKARAELSHSMMWLSKLLSSTGRWLVLLKAMANIHFHGTSVGKNVACADVMLVVLAGAAACRIFCGCFLFGGWCTHRPGLSFVRAGRCRIHHHQDLGSRVQAAACWARCAHDLINIILCNSLPLSQCVEFMINCPCTMMDWGWFNQKCKIRLNSSPEKGKPIQNLKGRSWWA